jgi:hypothetical protein
VAGWYPKPVWVGDSRYVTPVAVSLETLGISFLLELIHQPKRVVSFMNSLWKSEKTQLPVGNLKAVLITRVDFEYTSVDFFKILW